MKKPAIRKSKPAARKQLIRTYSKKANAPYLLFLPKGYRRQNPRRWPVILFLHGSGERGQKISSTKIPGPTKFIQKNPDFPFIVISPWCAADHKWSDDTLLGILDEVMKKHAVNPRRVYLTGLSMGGFATWSLATTHPERFAAVAPICGGDGQIGIVLSLGDKKKSPALKQLPIWVFHGAKDEVVELRESQRMVAAMKKIGNRRVKFTVYPEAAHDSWTQTYNNPELYEWFLQHEL